MKIGLDLRILERGCPTGVERAWRGLVHALLAREDAGRFVLYSREPVDLGVDLPAHAQAVPLGGPRMPSMWRESHLAPALRQDGVDLLHTPVAAIPMRTPVPRVATVHEIPWIRHPGIEGRARETAHRVRVRLAAGYAAAVVVPSRQTRDDLVSIHPDAAGKIVVVPHATDALFRDPPSPDGDAAALAAVGVGKRPWLLAAGALRDRKDPRTLLRAFRAYRKQGGDRDLVLTGPGDPPKPLDAGIHWVGWVEDRTFLALLRGADALVYHSLNEGFGLPPLEAMALGVPVVAASAGSVPEVCGDAALLVPPGEIAPLTAGLQRITGDADLRTRLITAGRARAAGFTWDAAVDRLVPVWSAIAEARRTKRAAAASKQA